MPNPLNQLERRVLEYIVDYLGSHTYQPSIREIGREFSIKSTKTVSELLQSLADKGWIERDPSRSRGVRVLGMERHPGTVSVPVLAGDAVNGLDYFEIDRRFVGAPGAFLMSMPGDHMQEEGIRAGDLLLVEPVTDAPPAAADLVVYRVGDTNLVRRVSRSDGDIVLEPAGGDTSVTLSPEQADSLLQGRVAGVIRRLRPVAAHAVAVAAVASSAS